MKSFFKYILDFFFSLRTSLWLMGLMLLLMLVGAFIMPGRQEFQELHSVPMFEWIQRQPLNISWWLWGLIGIIIVLTINTLFCSIESLVKKRKVTQWLLLISPQIIHVGFLFMLLAHFFSAAGASQGVKVAGEGSMVNLLENKLIIKVKNISINYDYYGYISDWKVNVEYLSGNEVFRQDIISPNNPSVQNGFNINVKDLRASPHKAVLLQVNREPGALWALTGGILFMIGIVILVALRIRMEEKINLT